MQLVVKKCEFLEERLLQIYNEIFLSSLNDVISFT